MERRDRLVIGRPSPRYPALYQINTRVTMASLGATLGRPATLDDLPDSLLDTLGQRGFDWVWFLGVWQTGPASRAESLADRGWCAEFAPLVPDFSDADVPGSCFAVRRYETHEDFGGDPALARLRQRLHARGLRLLVDFVPNHVALDHRFVEESPAFLVGGTPDDLARAPRNFRRVQTSRGELILAHGRDPYFPGWSDTLQLDFGNPSLQAAMVDELLAVAARADGVRCDMAMLVLPHVFARTWGISAEPFWPRAIARVREADPGFLFMAEVYWDLEWELQQQGFDYTYDKRLYDRLRDRDVNGVRGHLRAGLDFQDRLARFLENHDEPRAAATFPSDVQDAAAIVTFLSPGLWFFHQGQELGWRVRLPVHVSRGPAEPIDPDRMAFYEQLWQLLGDPLLRDGHWRGLEPVRPWADNGSADAFIAGSWERDGRRMLVVVNYAPHQSQCRLPLTRWSLAGRSWRLRDRLSPAVYERDGAELESPGLYLDMPAWSYHAFEIEPL